jgi:hypothetical protein
MDEEASTHKGCNKDLLIGTSATHLAIGKDGKELFHATKLNRFVLLTCTYGGEATGRAHAELQRMAGRWIDKVTIICAATKAGDEKWNGVEAVLLRPDRYIAWTARSSDAIESMTASVVAVLRW